MTRGNMDWVETVCELREEAIKLRISNPDAALMKCRKAMEAIQYSIFEEQFGELPSTYIPFEKMMGKTVIGGMIPKLHQIEFNTIQEWGNYGSHFQVDGMPTPRQVDLAIVSLENLIYWRFPITKQIIEPKTSKSKSPLNKDKWGSALRKITFTTKKIPEKLTSMSAVRPEELLARAIEMAANEQGWALLSDLGNKLKKIEPNFTIISTGNKTLSMLVRVYPNFFEIRGEHPSAMVKNI